MAEGSNRMLVEMQAERESLLYYFQEWHAAFRADAFQCRFLYYCLVVASVCLGPATGVVGAVSTVPAWAKITLGCATAIVAALSTRFQFRREWLRHALARDDIGSLIRRYRSTTRAVQDAERLERLNREYFEAFDRIRNRQRRDWRRTLRELDHDPSNAPAELSRGGLPQTESSPQTGGESAELGLAADATAE